MKTAPRGAAGCSAYLHRQYDQEPQGRVHEGRHTTGYHGSPQRLPIGTESVSIRLDHYTKSAYTDSAPHNGIPRQRTCLENSSA